MNKKLPVSVAIAITVIAMTVTFAITWLLSMNIFNNTVSEVTQLQAQYTKLAEMDNYIRGNFYGEIDNDYLFDRVATGYMNGLGDRNSVYYTAKEYADLLAVESGQLLGIGVEVVRDGDGSFRIVRVYDDSPAAKAGVEVQGRILTIDGTDTSAITTTAALHSALRGEEGTELEITCLYGVADEKSFTVQRVAYTAPTVYSEIIEGYAYIRVSSFTEATYTDFDYAVRTAQNAGVKGIVFDVRGTSQGLFRNSYDVIDLLCPRGTVAKSMNKTGVVSVLATSDDNFVDLPMVVLVNGGTSGAAELFAVSLRDMCDAQLVGATTAGKGTIQSSPRRLSDGSAVSITTAMLLTGRDESFHGTGLTPDVPVDGEMVSEEMLLNPAPMRNSDAQVLRAFELLRSMVRESGVDPGPAFGSTQPSSDVSGEEDPSLAGEDASDVSGDESDASGDASASDDSSDASSSSQSRSS